MGNKLIKLAIMSLLRLLGIIILVSSYVSCQLLKPGNEGTPSSKEK